MLYCQATAGLMITELHKLSSENLFIKAGKCLTFYDSYNGGYCFSVCQCPFLLVIAVSNLACGLFNRRLYDQAFTLVEVLCKDLCRKRPVFLSVDRVSF